MKALCIADFHAEETCLELLKKLLTNEKPELVLVGGDVTHRGSPLDYAEDVLEVIAQSNAKCFAVHGNMDSIRVKNLFEEKGISLHRKSAEFGGVRFVGYGGSNPTPFGTIVEYSEKQIYEELSPLTDRNTVLLTHFPPYGVKADTTRDLKHAGSLSLRKIIEEKKPRAVVCAHIHEASGVQQALVTRIIKIPPLMHGGAVAIDFLDETKINGIRFLRV